MEVKWFGLRSPRLRRLSAGHAQSPRSSSCAPAAAVQRQQLNLLDRFDKFDWTPSSWRMFISCVYIHAYMHACMHACMHAYTHVCTHACARACTHVYTHACTHVYIHVYMYTCSPASERRLCGASSSRMSMHMSVHMYTCLCTVPMSIHMSVHMFTCICTTPSWRLFISLHSFSITARVNACRKKKCDPVRALLIHGRWVPHPARSTAPAS